MKIANYEKLIEQFENAKLGDMFNKELKEKMEQGIDNITMSLQKAEGKNVVKIEPEVNRSKSMPDYYFFNHLKLTVTDEKGKDISFRFRMDPKDSITYDQGVSMLLTRSVLKDLVNRENEPYQAWQLLGKDEQGNLKIQQYNRKAWGYEVDEALNRVPIIGLEDPEYRAGLVKKLENGEQVNISVPKAVEYKNDLGEAAVKVEVKEYLIEASPRFKFFDFAHANTGVKFNMKEREDIKNLLANNEALLAPGKEISTKEVIAQNSPVQEDHSAQKNTKAKKKNDEVTTGKSKGKGRKVTG